MKVLYNNSFILRDEAMIDMEDRGYQFGDGVYEVIRIYNGKSFMLDEHISRLMSSAKKIKIDICITTKKIKEKLKKLLTINNLKDGIIYIQITRGKNERIHEFPSPAVPVQMIAYTKEINSPFNEQEKGVAVTL